MPVTLLRYRGEGVTVIDELVLPVIPAFVTSLAVTVAEPIVLSVTLNALVPATNAALIGRAAAPSVEVIATVSVLLTTFQLASTPFTVTLNAVPVTELFGVPVLPVADPAEAVSPGSRICSLLSAPALTVIGGLVLAVFAPSVLSVAVMVRLPAVLRVMLKVWVPATRSALAGRSALVSLEVIATVSVLVTTFQFASTAFAVTLKAVPATRALGVPVFPEALPAKAVSPGTNNCNLENAPAFTVVAGLVLEVFVPSVLLVAVTVREPAVFRVTLKDLVPATSDAFDGRVALASDEVIATELVLLTTFQFASTALTVTLKAVPAVVALGVPVLPVVLPGAADSPGTSNCILVNAPAFTVTDALTPAVFEPSVTSVAVTVALPAVFKVTLKLPVPAASAALAGSVALESVEVMGQFFF
jgi:hypothetical protein